MQEEEQGWGQNKFHFFNLMYKEHEELLEVQWMGLCAFTAYRAGLIPDRGTKILHLCHIPKDQNRKKERVKSKLWMEWAKYLQYILTNKSCTQIT